MTKKVLTKEQAENEVPDLPLAGYKRREELAERHDTLQEMAEGLDKETIPEKALEEDREIQYMIQEQSALEVSNKNPEFIYAWVFTGLGGQMIVRQRVKGRNLSGMRGGWMVVQGNDPEALEFKTRGSADTTRVVGDTILMKIHMDDYELIERYEAYKRQMQQEGINSQLQELGDKHRGKGLIVHTDVEGGFASGKGGSIMDTLRNRASQQMGTQVIDKGLRAGTIPGMPSPGRGRR